MNRQSQTELENDGAPVKPELLKELPEFAGLTPPKETPKHPRRGWLWVLALAVIAAAAAYVGGPKLKSMQSTPTPATAKDGHGSGTISVVGARAQKGNIGVYYTALGAVTPIYTVTVKSRVDGQLMNVFFKEGQIVKEGDTLIEIDTRPYDAALGQAEGQLARDQALLKNSLIDLDRYKVLFKQDAIPQQQLATQDALVEQYQGTIKTDEAAVDTAKLNVVYCHITSPINGLVGLRLVDPGNIVHATDTNGLLVITQLDPISVIFTLAEDQLPTVLEKMNASQQMRVEAWDRELKNKLVDGKLQTIDNQIDPTTGTLKLRATFENQNRKLFPSQFVNVRLLVEERSGVTLAPSAAIQRNTQGAYVWLVNPDRTVVVRPVTVGAVEGEQTQITGGLQPGDVVVTVGVDRLQQGSKVNAQVPGGKSRSDNS